MIIRCGNVVLYFGEQRYVVEGVVGLDRVYFLRNIIADDGRYVFDVCQCIVGHGEEVMSVTDGRRVRVYEGVEVGP